MESSNQQTNTRNQRKKKPNPKEPLFAECPECQGMIEVVAISCRIFRHGLGLCPHATDAEVEAWKKTSEGMAGMGCGAKLRWVDDKFEIHTGYDHRQNRQPRAKKDCMACKQRPTQQRQCRNCKEVVCLGCVEKVKNKCPQCWEEGAFMRATNKPNQNSNQQQQQQRPKKPCLLCENPNAVKPRFCSKCKQAVCYDCVHVCNNICPGCKQEGAFGKIKTKQNISDGAPEDQLLQLVISQGLEEDSLGCLFEQTAEEEKVGTEASSQPEKKKQENPEEEAEKPLLQKKEQVS